MSDLRLEWGPAERETLRQVRLQMLDESPVTVHSVFQQRNLEENFRDRSLHGMRPKLKEVDKQLSGWGTRPKTRSVVKSKSMLAPLRLSR